MKPCTPNGERSRDEDTSKADLVGLAEMRVTVAQRSPEAAERWDQRVDVLTAWLVAEWQRRQAREKTP